jgi:hypothetical protein
MADQKFTWEDVVNAEPGKVFVDRTEEGLRFIILRGPCHLCAYVGVPLDHPLAGFDYEKLPVRCHGGLTFGSEGTDEYLPKGRYWYGWDYGHCDDYTIYSNQSASYAEYNESRKKWGVAEVEGDSWEALWNFQKLQQLSEAIVLKAKGWR